MMTFAEPFLNRLQLLNVLHIVVSGDILYGLP